MTENKFIKKKTVVKGGSSAGLWFMGFLGTLGYYLHFHSGTFGLVVGAFVKALFWPVVFVYHILVLWHM